MSHGRAGKQEEKRIKQNRRKRQLPGQQGRDQHSKNLVNAIQAERRRAETAEASATQLSVQLAATTVTKKKPRPDG